ncbi:putative aldo-keto reductase [Naematelia encephala]|uniref:Putative aldo-keto reductase n=1 Tax=Naematelia encephala TaxID=71784 RepID=A0A1Y2BIF2_9TREE|nr:putative aldo-keto reductase [Naematelia encephala]
MVKLSLESTVKLSSGNTIPQLGYGVYQARGRECSDGVVEALKSGYRHVDSAQAYRNEDLVGGALSTAKIPRSQVFLTTKYMPTHQEHSVASVYSYLQKSLHKIDPESKEPYIDLMLIHAPWGGDEGRANNWAALAKAQKEGWIKDIGVSNFGVKHLEALPEPVPVINQIELHPFCQQREIVAYCEKHNIKIQAYCPLVRGDAKRFSNKVLVGISEKHGKEPSQVLLRWSLQKGYIPLPKSVTPSRIKSNADLYDFELDQGDMKALDGLDEGAKGACSWNPVDAD